MHYISCTADSLLLMTTISTLPERYRSCKCEPFQSEFHNVIHKINRDDNRTSLMPSKSNRVHH